MKIRHTVLALLAILAIAFMQPLVFFVGGLTLLLGIGALIFRDLSPAGQEVVERRILGWLRRARSTSAVDIEPPSVGHRPLAMTAVGPNAQKNTQKPERPRRVRTRTAAAIQNDPGPPLVPEASVRDEATSDIINRYEKAPLASPNDAI
ncbi:MAG: hypothetical protein KDJ31_02270 [Candidatus Competibacteraceae bacterium]|nr:hypothetical protein [Candidatus Competibacteraceae bacterium]MCB1822336.1 hypothetical protein [Candidatus Competibacteraceae bacterium]HRY15631.1 hypothetical protein [Candidatus Competibacteraceae bacterium]